MIKDYMAFLISKGKKSNTVKAYKINIEKFMIWLKERNAESEGTGFTTEDLQKYQDYLLNTKKYAASGVLQRMNAVVSYCKYLYMKRILPMDIVRDFEFHRVQNKFDVPEVINNSEMSKYRNEIYKGGNLRDIAIFELFLNTGIRASELIALEKTDLEMSEEKLIFIRDENDGLNRRIPLNSEARKALQAYLNTRQMKYHAGQKLWLGQRGPLTQDGINKMLKRYAERCDLAEKISPNAIRHYFASKLIREKKLDLVLAANVLGHTNINSTRKYSQPRLEDIAQALEDLHPGA